jgi:hypothetical protein
MMSEVWVNPFLDALRAKGKVSPAARTVGVSLSTIAARRKADSDFEAAVLEAISDCIDDMEAEMTRRAKDGVNKPVIYQGSLQYLAEPMLDDDGALRTDKNGNVLMKPALDANGKFVPLTVNERSDTLLMFALKGYRKEVFAERTELTGAGGKDFESTLSDAERTARVAALLEVARKRKEDDIG